MTQRLLARKADGTLDPDAIERAASLLRKGRLVAFPTETVYGLGADALQPAAVARVFEAKGRPRGHPLIVHVPGAAEARAVAACWTEAAQQLADAFWPGPLTLVLPRGERIPDEVTGGLDTVGVRAPDHAIAQELLRRAGVPLAAPSANRFGAVSPTTADHVLSSLAGHIDAVLDGGPASVGIESTVVDLSTPTPRLLRPGGISLEELAAVAGRVEVATGVIEEGPRASPGMAARHYAPQGAVTLAEPEALSAALSRFPANARVGAVVRTLLPPPADARIVQWERLGDDPRAFARSLYSALHRIDAAGATHVLLERLPADGAWRAVADRVQRAGGPR